MDDIDKITNIAKLLVKILKPTVDQSDAESATVETVVTTKKDKKKYKVEIKITPELTD